jgi:peptidoglycan/LPS O-acetylase OafA/YrhL
MGVYPVWALWLLGLFFMAMPVSGILYHFISMNAVTIFLPYLGYFLIGYLIRSVALRKYTFAVSLACYGSSSLAITLATGTLVGELGIEDPQALRYYNHFHSLVVIQSISMFFVLRCLFYAVDAPYWNKILRRLAPLTFGIYLVHVIFLDIARNYTSVLYENITLLGIVTELVIVYAISALASYVLLKIAGVRWVIGS